MKKYIVIFSLFLTFGNLNAQQKIFNPFTVNSRIKEAVEENDRQEKMLANQQTNTMVENENKNKIKQLKEKVKKIRSRLTQFSYVIDAYKLTTESTQIINRIKDNETYVINEIINKPQFALLEIDGAMKFYEQTEMVIRYMIVVVLSAGEISAMEPSDRKIITSFIIDELKDIERTSQNMKMLIQKAKMDYILKKNAFRNWVNKDKQLVKDVIRNAQSL